MHVFKCLNILNHQTHCKSSSFFHNLVTDYRNSQIVDQWHFVKLRIAILASVVRIVEALHREGVGVTGPAGVRTVE